MKTLAAWKNRILTVGLALAALASTAGTTAAAWDPNGNDLTPYGNNQLDQTVIPDGSGGMFVVYEDSATYYYGDNDVRAQRIDAYGNVLWGIVVSGESGHQRNPDACLDPATGGIFVVWEDNRAGNYDIYALRVLPDGTTTGWPAGGLGICAQPNAQLGPKVVSDGAGGFIAAWSDNRSGLFFDIYALRVNQFGGDVWTDDGVPVCTATYGQAAPTIAPDGSGGALIAWEDGRNVFFSDVDVYAQRLNSLGTQVWTSGGVPIAFGTYGDIAPRICADGAGGAFVVWEANPTGSARDVWGQHVNASGSVTWTSGGYPFTSFYTFEAHSPVITPDGAGGMVLAYQADQGFIYVSWDVVVQRIDGLGSASWSVSLGNPFTAETQPALSSVGPSGVAVAWRDDRNGNPDIYAQRFGLADGTQQWSAGGTLVSAVPEQQKQPE
ncbi:MAG: hypothetical protein OEO21_07490, partial [Candidatus Krumholzibacteria bacterium]|nr:hypothetical protein [Candidatus Krumholzibacteria bacterium]